MPGGEPVHGKMRPSSVNPKEGVGSWSTGVLGEVPLSYFAAHLPGSRRDPSRCFWRNLLGIEAGRVETVYPGGDHLHARRYITCISFRPSGLSGGKTQQVDRFGLWTEPR